jgi:hypothetical protein
VYWEEEQVESHYYKLGMVIHAYSLSYLRGKDFKFKASPSKVSDTLFQKQNKKIK